MHHTATISDPMPIKPPPTSSSSHHHHLLSRKPKFRFFIITMASLFSFTLFLTLILFFTLSSATSRHHPPKSKPKPPSALSPPPPEIKQACKATRFPETCETTVSKAPNITQNPNPIQIIQSALWVSSDNRKTAQSMVKEILAAASGDPNHTTAAKNCLEVLHYSDYRVSSTADVLSSGKTRIKDARAWMSAALLYDYACWSSLKYVNDSQLVNRTMAFMDSLIGFTSNALSMMVSYDLFGDEIQSWKPPMTERSGSWEQNGGNSGSDLGFHEVVPSNLAADVTVCQDGGAGCVKTVQEAVNAAPDNLEKEKKFVIRIKAGVYKEIVRVPLEKKNLVFLGEGMGKTVITGSLYAGQPGISTFNTATVGVNGDGFMARDMTFENTAGPDAHQAVAFRSDSDLSILENCEFLGNQDTLYADSLRQFYKSCRIEGNVDFIFGNSAAVFQDSQILVRPRQIKPEKGENNAITAHGRTDPAQSTGFVFENCMINGTEAYMKLYYSKPKVHRNYLGRPWKEYSRTVFLNCYLDALVASAGWMPWSGDFALSTLYYGEFENKGPGANTTDRVSWSSQIPKEHVLAYSVQSFIQGNDWIHSSS